MSDCKRTLTTEKFQNSLKNYENMSISFDENVLLLLCNKFYHGINFV